MECTLCRCPCSCSCSCSPSPSPSDAASRRHTASNFQVPNRPQKLKSIEQSTEHRLTLLDWTAQLTASRKNLVRKLSSRNSSISNLYRILGFFFVFAGVVISAAAHASALKCHNWWLIFTLFAITSVTTLLACIQKLKEIAQAEENYLEEKALCSSLFNSIEQLKEKGSAFDLVAGQPILRYKHTNLENPSSDSSKCSARIFWKAWVQSYAGAVFVVLLAFSGVTLAAVRLIVCDPRRNGE